MRLNTSKICRQTTEKVEIIGYIFRGQGRFATSILKIGSPKIRSFDLLKNQPFWVQADADFHKALQLYGNPNTKIDRTYETIMVWSNLVGAYYATFERKNPSKEVKTLMEEKDHKLIFEAIGGNTSKPAHLPVDNNCDGKIKLNIEDSSFCKIAEIYSFASASIAMDLSDIGEVSNIRVLASVPIDEFAETLTKSVAKQRATIAVDTPKECLKDYKIYVNFVTY